MARQQLWVVFEIFGLSKLEDEETIFAECIGKFFFFILCHTFRDIVGLTKLKKKNNVMIQIHHLVYFSYFLYIKLIGSHKSLDAVNQMNFESFGSDEQTKFMFV